VLPPQRAERVPVSRPGAVERGEGDIDHERWYRQAPPGT
jgi:hypothetical protein